MSDIHTENQTYVPVWQLGPSQWLAQPVIHVPSVMSHGSSYMQWHLWWQPAPNRPSVHSTHKCTCTYVYRLSWLTQVIASTTAS